MELVTRARLAALLDGCGISHAVLGLRHRLRFPWLTVINYHRVHAPSAATPFDEGVLDATPDSLDHQLRILKRHFTIIGLEDLLAHLRGRPLPPNRP